jgi:cation transport ATPase
MLGKIPLPIGVVGHEGSTVVVVMNSLRLLFGNVQKSEFYSTVQNQLR